MNRLLLLLAFAALFSTATFADGPSSARKTKRNVEVEFEAVEGATLYEIKIIPTRGSKKPQLFKLETPKWSANIKPGLYNMQLRAYDERGVPGEWSPPSELKVKLESVVTKTPTEAETIKSEKTGTQDVKFTWEAVPSARKYKFKAHSKNSDFKVETEVDETETTASLPVAEEFEWTVLAIDDKNDEGEPADKPSTFTVNGGRLDTPRVARPLSKFIESLEWSAPTGATSYATVLEYKDSEGKWTQVERNEDVKENLLKFDSSRPSGRYRLSVQAKAERREPSKVGRREFDVIGGFKTPEDLQTAQKRDAITRSGNNYVIASYMISDISYSAQNYDTNAGASFSAVGGTLRLGYGHQSQDSNWGGYILADMSGFSIDGSTQTYASTEAHVTRKLEFGQSGLLQVGAGLFYKELPIVTGSPVIGFESLGKLTEIGPHLGATYWLPLTHRWGLQANVRLYDGFMGSAAGGGKLENSVSYQYGLLGSYHMSTNWIGYAGYTLRHDEAHYDASPGAMNFSSQGEVNGVTIEGHYLNLTFEYSF